MGSYQVQEIFGGGLCLGEMGKGLWWDLEPIFLGLECPSVLWEQWPPGSWAGGMVQVWSGARSVWAARSVSCPQLRLHLVTGTETSS